MSASCFCSPSICSFALAAVYVGKRRKTENLSQGKFGISSMSARRNYTYAALIGL